MHFTHDGGYLHEHKGNCNTFKHIYSLPLVHRPKGVLLVGYMCWISEARDAMKHFGEQTPSVNVCQNKSQSRKRQVTSIARDDPLFQLRRCPSLHRKILPTGRGRTDHLTSHQTASHLTPADSGPPHTSPSSPTSDTAAPAPYLTAPHLTRRHPAHQPHI